MAVRSFLVGAGILLLLGSSLCAPVAMGDQEYTFALGFLGLLAFIAAAIVLLTGAVRVAIASRDSLPAPRVLLLALLAIPFGAAFAFRASSGRLPWSSTYAAVLVVMGTVGVVLVLVARRGPAEE